MLDLLFFPLPFSFLFLNLERTWLILCWIIWRRRVLYFLRPSHLYCEASFDAGIVRRRSGRDFAAHRALLATVINYLSTHMCVLRERGERE